MMSQTGKQIIAIHILPNTSRSKDNQEMMFGQLTEHNIKNTFLKNQTKNAVRKLVPNRSIKTQNWAYLWINSLEYYTVFFMVCPSGDLPNVLKYVTV